MKYFIAMTGLALGVGSVGCSKDKEPETQATAQEDQTAFEEVGGTVGGAAEDVGSGVEEGTVDTVEYTTIEGTQRYECEDGTEFQIDYENDGRSARITLDERQYWVDMTDEGKFSSKEGQFWTVGDDRANLELSGREPLMNCEKK